MTRTPKPNPEHEAQIPKRCPAHKIEVKTPGLSLMHECKKLAESDHDTHECFCGKTWPGGAES